MDVNDVNDKPVEVSIYCSACDGQIRVGDRCCPGCGRTITRAEKSALQARLAASDSEYARSSDEVAYGRFALLAVAGLAALNGFISGGLLQSPAIVACCAVLMIVMLGLFFLGARYPLTALVIGLAIYLGVVVLLAVLEPLSLGKGLVFKILILIALAGGIGATLAMRRRERR